MPGEARLAITVLLIKHGGCLNVTTVRGYTILDRCVVHYVIGGGWTADALGPLVATGANLRPMVYRG